MKSPLKGGAWREKLDTRFSEQILEKILNRECVPPDWCLKEMLQGMDASRALDIDLLIPGQLYFGNFKRFYKNQDEKNTPSPSGMHYGHLNRLYGMSS